MFFERSFAPASALNVFTNMTLFDLTTWRVIIIPTFQIKILRLRERQ